MGICGQYRTRQKIVRPIPGCTFLCPPDAIINNLISERPTKGQTCCINVVQVHFSQGDTIKETPRAYMRDSVASKSNNGARNIG